MNFSKITTWHKLIAAGVFIGIVCLLLYFVMKKDTSPPKPTPTPRKTTPPKTTPPKTTPPKTTPPKTPPPPPPAKKEVYFADKASDYTISSLAEAIDFAVSLGGILADRSHLRDAMSAGLDVCRLGRASDGYMYTVTIGYHGYESGCKFGENSTVGLKSYTPAAGQKTGVWVYGVKPSVYERCVPSGVIPCVLPFSTITNKWSQYS